MGRTHLGKSFCAQASFPLASRASCPNANVSFVPDTRARGLGQPADAIAMPTRMTEQDLVHGRGTVGAMGTQLVVGHSKLPQGSTAVSVSPTLALTLLVDGRHGVILAAECTLVTELARSTVRSLLVGQCLTDGLDAAVQELTSSYHGMALSAVVAALRDAHTQWTRIANMPD